MSAPPDGSPGQPGPSPRQGWLTRWNLWVDAWPARTFTKFIVFPLVSALLSAMLIGRIVDHFVGPKTYYVFLVGDGSDPATEKMLDAASGSVGNTFGGVKVETEIRSDLADPNKAESLAKELVERPDVLMVIGHGSSSASQRALPVYLKANPSVPVILTTDTNPRLLAPPAPTDDSVPPVFRLFPTDDNQASVGAAFVSSRKAKALWLIEDAANVTYSHYLTRAFLDELYEKYPDAKVVLWSNNLSLPPYAVDRLGIDWVFFAGDWRDALILIRQVKALPGQNKPGIILSDSAADKRLTQLGSEDIDGVYVLHPLPADVFNQSEYVVVGQEANALTTALLRLANQDFETLAAEGEPVGYRVRQLLGLRRVGDARRALARAMAKAVRNELSLSHSNRTFQMATDPKTRIVVRKNASFHVWQAKGARFVPVQ